MRRWFALVLIQWAALLPTTFLTIAEAEEPGELATLSVGEYGVKVQAPANWKLVVKAEEILAFGLAIPTDDPAPTAGVKCEIGPAPESLDEFRTRIDRRAARESAPGRSLASNEVRHADNRDQLVTLW